MCVLVGSGGGGGVLVGVPWKHMVDWSDCSWLCCDWSVLQATEEPSETPELIGCAGNDIMSQTFVTDMPSAVEG